jgi:hypothetical protein
MTELTIIVPSIHPDRWTKVRDSIKNSCGDIDYELIFVGPYESPDKSFLFIKDLGTPTVAFQRAALQAEGKYIAISSDDSTASAGAIHRHFRAFDSATDRTPRDFMVCTYVEGVNLPDYPHPRISMFGNFYWHIMHHYHTRRQQTLGLQDWIWGQFLIDTEYFIHLGGLDCIFEHANYSLIDFCIRCQREGGRAYVPQEFIWDTEFIEKPPSDAVAQAGVADLEFFLKYYATPEVVTARSAFIPYDNWTNFPDNETWKRRNFKK